MRPALAGLVLACWCSSVPPCGAVAPRLAVARKSAVALWGVRPGPGRRGSVLVAAAGFVVPRLGPGRLFKLSAAAGLPGVAGCPAVAACPALAVWQGTIKPPPHGRQAEPVAAVVGVVLRLVSPGGWVLPGLGGCCAAGGPVVRRPGGPGGNR